MEEQHDIYLHGGHEQKCSVCNFDENIKCTELQDFEELFIATQSVADAFETIQTQLTYCVINKENIDHLHKLYFLADNLLNEINLKNMRTIIKIAYIPSMQQY